MSRIPGEVWNNGTSGQATGTPAPPGVRIPPRQIRWPDRAAG